MCRKAPMENTKQLLHSSSRLYLLTLIELTGVIRTLRDKEKRLISVLVTHQTQDFVEIVFVFVFSPSLLIQRTYICKREINCVEFELNCTAICK